VKRAQQFHGKNSKTPGGQGELDAVAVVERSRQDRDWEPKANWQSDRGV
jgi:hypothetical protein